MKRRSFLSLGLFAAADAGAAPLLGSSSEALAFSSGAQANLPDVGSLAERLGTFHRDGLTSDDANFSSLEEAGRNQIVDLHGYTFAVAAIPTGNVYVNGFWKIGDRVFDAASSPELLSSATDTGGAEAAYAGGYFGAPTLPGRSTAKTTGILWSQNSRALGHPRAGVIAGIYSFAQGLCSLVLAGRQSAATQPQSIVIGSEESFIDTGSRSAVVSSINSVGEGVGALVGASRSSRASGWESAVIGSNASVAGAGSGARFLVHVVNGAVAAVDILDGGAGYIDPAVDITDRVGTGSGAEAKVAVKDGVVTAVRILKGGAGYSPVENAVNFHLRTRRSMVVAGSNGSSARGNQSLVGASLGGDAVGNQSAVIASTGTTATGTNAAALACGPLRRSDAPNASCVASGDNSLVAASDASAASGPTSAVIASVGSSATGRRSLVVGSSRVVNQSDDTIVVGSAPSGRASPANIKARLNAASGDLEIAGVLTQNRVFTDIAKMFENLTPGIAIPVGALVTLEGRKLRLATAGDTFFSVHSRTYAQLLGDTAFTWSGRYLRDEHGEILTEEIPDPDWQAEIPDPDWPAFVINPAHPVIETLTGENGEPLRDADGNPLRTIVSSPTIANPAAAPLVPNPKARPLITVEMENPDYDPEREQIPRSRRRADWTPMLLFGEAFTHVTADVGVDDYIEPVAPGIGGRAHQRTAFRCMEVTTPFDPAKGYAIALCLRV